jgi:peptidase C25-like protein
MKKRKISSLLLLFVAFMVSFGNAQVYNVDLKWGEAAKTSLFPGSDIWTLGFSGSEFSSEFGLLPVYIQPIPLSDPNIDFDLQIKNAVYENLDFDLGKLEDAHLIQNAVGLSGALTSSRGENQLLVKVVPIRINEKTGKPEKLISFALEVKITENEAASPERQVSAFADNSVLNIGDWYKLKIEQRGIHKVSFLELKEAGVDVDQIDPATIQVFGNGAGMLPEKNSLDRMDDLIENSVWVSGSADNSFDEGDYVLFYAEGATQWNYNPFKKLYNHKTNIYDDYTYYYFTYGQALGKRVELEDNNGMTPDYNARTYTDYLVFEEDEQNVIKSGKLWVGESMMDAPIKLLEYTFPGIVADKNVQLELAFTARVPGESFLDVNVNGAQLAQESLPTVNFSSVQYGYSRVKIYSFLPSGEDLELELAFKPFDSKSNMWIDYVEMNVKRELSFESSQLMFCDPDAIATDRVSKFFVGNSNANIRVWEVSDKFNISEIETNFVGDTLTFICPTDTLKEFVAWDGTDYRQAEVVGKVENQNLHSFGDLDMVIVTAPQFADQAERLGQLHQLYDGFSYAVVSTDEIYNEFSSGKTDPAAIRDFVRMIYERDNDGNKLAYLLLFGDGSYDQKDRKPELFPSLIPAFQSLESLKITYSFVTDDFYGQMDPSEGFDAIGDPDVGIGRLPVNTIEQAEVAVDKIENYIVNSAGNTNIWRNEIFFVADDEDGNTHLDHAEELATIIDTGNKQFHVNKIYYDAYQQISGPGGDRYPDVSQAIDEAVQNGSLLFNYTGHGGELGWADEKVLVIPTINGWENVNKMPIFVTATCEFSRFDNQAFESAGELVFLNPSGGGVALFTTTRLSYSSTNFTLNKRFYLNAFEPIETGLPRLGDIIRISKKSSNLYIKNFVLLGDPALRLAYPQYTINTSPLEMLNSEIQDTMQALNRVKVKGEIVDSDGLLVDGFNGLLHPRIFDKYTKLSTLGNDNNSSPVVFTEQNKCVFKGTASIKNGAFEFTFVVPKDIDYGFGTGKIYFYAVDTSDFSDANGYKEFVIGGVNENAEADLQGPEIELYLNGNDFVDGDIVDAESILLAHLYDVSGINYYGNGIGHDLTASIDGDPEYNFVVNDYYQSETDDFTRGNIVFSLPTLDEGKHTLKLKAWDVFNNSSTTSIDFYIGDESQINVSGVSNLPNPFGESTSFEVEAQGFGDDLDLNLKVFAIGGKMVYEYSSQANLSNQDKITLVWDGRGNSGHRLDGGTYVYSLTLCDTSGKKRILSNKLVILY